MNTPQQVENVLSNRRKAVRRQERNPCGVLRPGVNEDNLTTPKRRVMFHHYTRVRQLIQKIQTDRRSIRRNASAVDEFPTQGIVNRIVNRYAECHVPVDGSSLGVQPQVMHAVEEAGAQQGNWAAVAAAEAAAASIAASTQPRGEPRSELGAAQSMPLPVVDEVTAAARDATRRLVAVRKRRRDAAAADGAPSKRTRSASLASAREEEEEDGLVVRAESVLRRAVEGEIEEGGSTPANRLTATRLLMDTFDHRGYQDPTSQVLAQLERRIERIEAVQSLGLALTLAKRNA